MLFPTSARSCTAAWLSCCNLSRWHQTQAAIRHCWCRTRIRRVVGPWYQQHSWQSSWLAALQSTGALKLTQKDSNHKVNRDKKVATTKRVALFGFFFNAIRVSQQLSLRTRWIAVETPRQQSAGSFYWASDQSCPLSSEVAVKISAGVLYHQLPWPKASCASQHHTDDGEVCITRESITSALMAKGYWNISGAVTNPEGMGPYLQAVEPYLAKFNARFLCR